MVGAPPICDLVSVGRYAKISYVEVFSMNVNLRMFCDTSKKKSDSWLHHVVYKIQMYIYSIKAVTEHYFMSFSISIPCLIYVQLVMR